MAYDDQIHRQAVRFAIEKAILQIGTNDLEKVQSLLRSKYNYDIENCIDHPDALKDILCESYNSHYSQILESIIETLSGSSIDFSIENFIKALK